MAYPTYANALRMMQGGEDRTGYAGMLENMSPGDLLRQRRAEAAAKVAAEKQKGKESEINDFMQNLADSLTSGSDLMGGDGTGDLGPILGTSGPDIRGRGLDDKGFFEDIFDKGEGVIDWFQENMDKYRQENFPTEPDPNDPFSSAYQGQFFDTGGIVPKRGLVDGPGGYAGRFEETYWDKNHPWRSGINTMTLLELLQALGPAVGMNDGGRVGMFLGGTTSSGTVSPNPGAQPLNQSGIGGALIGLINQNPQIQQQLLGLNQQNYNLPTQIQNQMYTPPQTQQAWNPYVNAGPAAGSMGFYDPSTLDMPVSNDPVMLGGPDPYQMYDPYTPAIPDRGIGPRPAINAAHMLTPEEISRQFADTEKFSLEAQRIKAEKEAEARKAAERQNQYREHQGPKYDREERQRRVHHGGGNGGAQ